MVDMKIGIRTPPDTRFFELKLVLGGYIASCLRIDRY